MHALDNALWHALTGPHRRFAQGAGHARRYAEEISPFFAIRDASETSYRDLGALLADRQEAILFQPNGVGPPAGWHIVNDRTIVQMTCDRPMHRSEQRIRVQPLSLADVDDMLALVDRTKPGPFGPRTVELGAYLGIRIRGRLVAMAGERFRLSGYTEVSAICTLPEYRGRGYARALVNRLLEAIFARSEVPFLHVFPHNRAALRLYRTLGFTERARLDVWTLRKRPNE